MDNKEQRPQSVAEQFIRMDMLSRGSSAGQILNFIKNTLRCRYKILPIDDEEVLIIYGYDLNDNDPGMPVGRGQVEDGKFRSDSALDACFDFLGKMQDAKFLDKVIIYSLTHGRWAQSTEINDFSSIHG